MILSTGGGGLCGLGGPCVAGGGGVCMAGGGDMHGWGGGGMHGWGACMAGEGTCGCRGNTECETTFSNYHLKFESFNG